MRNPKQPIKSREIKNFARHIMRELSLVGIRQVYPKIKRCALRVSNSKVFSSGYFSDL